MVQCALFFILFSLALIASTFSSLQKLGAHASISGPKGVSGSFRFSSVSDSDEVKVVISMSGLLQFDMPNGFAYHIHQNPIDADGDCSSGLGHFKVWSPKPSCKSENPEWCQPAELPLRHGNLTGTVDKFTQRYSDPAISLSGPDTIVGRSIVIQGDTLSRIACGTIETWVPDNTV